MILQSLLFLLLVISIRSEISYLTEIKITEIPFASLFALDSSASYLASSTLVTIGAVAITDIPGFAAARQLGLSNLADCLSREVVVRSSGNSNIKITLSADGSRKLSTGEKSKPSFQI